MDHSALYDEIRLHVGLAHDYSITPEGFLHYVMNAFQKYWPHKDLISLYVNKWTHFEWQDGDAHQVFMKEMDIQNGLLLLADIKRTVFCCREEGMYHWVLPFYDNEVFAGGIIVSREAEMKELEKEEVWLLEEIMAFINAKLPNYM